MGLAESLEGVLLRKHPDSQVLVDEVSEELMGFHCVMEQRQKVSSSCW